ncbi:MAG: tRNA (adenosine(37)-N6)-threonylcarbamoyltransferase complex dimerization subunit type 1 TsaB [Hyphomicrobiaceae bacterium]|nr:tRNA (adenosine(37)-N6)-threonylcarbamoyltransferase complex dimerization subunit type 1 TsaB [Hyphomicrobiaceae bacterium]
MTSTTGLVLAIDTCLESCSVAIGGGVLGKRFISRHEAMAKGQAERVLAMAADIMSEAHAVFRDIEMIAVTVGPGSFTGTRIGLAAAKGLALAIGCRSAGFSSLHVIGRQIGLARPSETSSLCVALDMGRDDVYAQLLDSDGVQPRSTPQLISKVGLEGFVATNGARLFLRGPRGPDALGQNGLGEIPRYFIPHSETVVALVTQSSVKLRPVAPLYLRAPDAKPGKKVVQGLSVGGS